MATPQTHRPSGLFPAGPPRPAYREPHPVRTPGVLGGLAGGGLWLLLFGAVGSGSITSYAWWTGAAGAVGWGAAVALARFGDRGVAVGLAVSVAIAWATTATLVAVHWAVTGDWPLW